MPFESLCLVCYTAWRLRAPVCYLIEFGGNSGNSSSESSSDEEDATQLDILLALSPDVCMLVPQQPTRGQAPYIIHFYLFLPLRCDLTKGEFCMGDVPVIVRDFGNLEFPYGGSTFIAALMLAKHMEFSLRGLQTLQCLCPINKKQKTHFK